MEVSNIMIMVPFYVIKLALVFLIKNVIGIKLCLLIEHDIGDKI